MDQILGNISDLVEQIDYKTQLMGRKERLISGIENTRFQGMLTGFIIMFVFVAIPILYYKGGI